MNIKTIKNFIAILIVTVSFTSAASAFAYVPGVWDPQPRVNINEPAFYKVPMTYDAPLIIQTTPIIIAPVNQDNNNNTNTQPPVIKKVVTNVQPATNRASSTSMFPASQIDNQLKPVVTTNTNNNGLTALSLAGSGGFMPSSIWQWFLVVLFILAIIIIVRMLTRPDQNEVHTVTTH